MNKENIRQEQLDILIKESESLVYNIVRKYSKYYNLEDLYQTGMIGVIKASNHYDVNSNTKFSSYAYKFILGEVIDYIKKDRNIVISDEIFSVYKNYTRIKDLLFSKLEREPTLKEVCEVMEINEEYLVKVIETVAFTKSDLNENEYYLDDRDNLINKILINEELDLLNEFERSIIDYRYYQGYTQCETADIMGLSQAKVSREEKLILSRIKSNIAN